MRSYTVSTGRRRQPGGEIVACRVHVAVMHRAAVARPLADVQRHLRPDRPAGPAQLGAGEPAVDHHEFAPVPGALVLQHGAQFHPRRVRDGAREPAVLQQVADGEVLDHDRLVLTDETSRQLVQEVPAPVGDPGMDAGGLHAGLGPVVGALGLAGQLSLSAGETGAVPALMLRVGDLLPGGQGHQGGDPGVQADRRVGGGGRGDGVLDEHRDEPAPGAVTGHGHRRRLRPLGKRTRPADVQGLGRLGQSQSPVAPREGAAGVLGRRPGLLPALVARVLRPPGEEVPERRLEMAQRLLERDGGHLRQEGQLLGLLPLRQRGRRLHVGDAALLAVPGPGAVLQRLVVHEADAAERARQLGRLLVRGVKAVLESPLDLLRHASRRIRFGVSDGCRPMDDVRRSALATNRPSLPCSGGASFPPRPEGRGIHEGEPR